MPIIYLTKAQKIKRAKIRRAAAAGRLVPASVNRRRRAARRIGRMGRRFINRRRQLVPYRRRTKPEMKLLGTTDINPENANGTPVQAVNNANVYWKGYCLTSVPSAWTSGLVDLAGMNPAPGVDGHQRIGSYVNFSHTTLTMEIATEFSSSGKPPLQFRVVVVKSLQAHVPAGTTDAPGATLFLDNIGNAQGITTAGSSAMTSFEFHNNLINKRDWIVYRDQRFTLSHPARSDSDGGYIGYSGRYPIKKNFRFNLKHNAHTRLGAANLPQDYDGHYLVMVFCSNATADSGTPDQWKITMRGTTSYTDV